jgi:hypothetical protein
MPPKKITKDTWDKMPDELRAAMTADYTEKDGEYHLNAPAPDSANEERLRKLRETADRNANRAQEAEAKLAALPTDEEGNPLDAERIAELVEEARSLKETAEKTPTKVKENVDKAVQEARKKWDKDRLALERERDDERSVNHELLVRNVIRSFISEKIHPDHADAVEALLETKLRPMVLREVKEGKPVRTAVTAADGFNEELRTYLDEKWATSEAAKRYLRAEDNSGGDGGKPTPEGKPDPSGQVTKKTDFKTNADRVAYIEKHGADAYGALPAG